jgi:hypothetical protein
MFTHLDTLEGIRMGRHDCSGSSKTRRQFLSKSLQRCAALANAWVYICASRSHEAFAPWSIS